MKRDIHDAIDEWHDMPAPGPDCPLHEFLGMTHEQYPWWVEFGKLPEDSPYSDSDWEGPEDGI